MATDGLITMASRFAAKETMDRLETETKARGMTVFARIDHAAGAAAGLPLRRTELLIFGIARGGTPLMQAEQTIGIDPGGSAAPSAGRCARSAWGAARSR